MIMKCLQVVKMLIIVAMWQSAALALIEGTPHDLSALPGGNSCSFCHTPHGALPGTPLWNHKLSTAVYKIYESSSLKATVGQPTGSSKLCLSCHDGTVALTETLNSQAGGAYINPGAANLGTDLSNDHPISFVYSASLSTEDTQIRPSTSLPSTMKLDRAGELQCTTCHEPHDNKYGNFLVASNLRSAMCISCHDLRGWMTSIHQTSAASVKSSSDTYLQNSQYTTVADNACLDCHRPHSAGGPQRLLHYYKSEDNCLNCHDGTVASTNLKLDLSKVSRHDVTGYSNVHDIAESPFAMPRHVQCADCHNPHAAKKIQSQAPLAKGVMREVSGITSSGMLTQQAQFEYEICFKCHADSAAAVQPSITRQITQTNARLEFAVSNPSFHPVISPGFNKNVPSLVSPMTVTTMIYCTDCHSSDNTSGTKGPHGSNYPNLLAFRYETADYTQESSFAYELCYKCHSRNSIQNDQSFKEHHKHITDEKAPCSACHDAHGINSAQGTISNNSHLINFDTAIVSKDPRTGFLKFEDLGMFHGRCYLVCHGESHSPESY